MPMPTDMGGYTPQQSGSGPSLTAFNPTWRDRMAQMLMGDAKPSPEKARLVEGLMGSRGLGSTGMGVADLTPAGIPMQAQEAYRAGDDRMLAMALMPGPKKPGIKAFHGSPHDFDKFDMSKIGTGEGAQAYGHGLYFAEAEDVAQSYKTTLTNAKRDVAGENARLKQLGLTDNQISQVQPFINTTGDPDAGLRDFTSWTGVKPTPELKEAFADIVKNKPQGRMYEVNIRAEPDDFLDWDRPLSQQPEKIKEAMNRLAGGEILPNYTGEDAYKSAAMQMGSPKFLEDPELSARVRDAGISGVKYLDQGSRTGLGEGSRNYVLFRDDIIEITKKYGVAFATALYGAEAVKQATGEQ